MCTHTWQHQSIGTHTLLILFVSCFVSLFVCVGTQFLEWPQPTDQPNNNKQCRFNQDNEDHPLHLFGLICCGISGHTWRNTQQPCFCDCSNLLPVGCTNHQLLSLTHVRAGSCPKHSKGSFGRRHLAVCWDNRTRPDGSFCCSGSLHPIVAVTLIMVALHS